MAGAHTARACLLALTATAWLAPSRSQQLEDALPALSPLASLNLDEHGPGRQCAQDTRALVAAVRNRTLWAVRMLDASARVSSGVLWGARCQLGSYDGCIAVGASSPVGARYCLVSVNHKTDGQARGTWETVEDLPPYQDVSTVLRGEGMLPGSLPLGDIRMGLCVPASCTAATLQAALQAGLDPSVRVHVGPENCQEHVTGASLSTGATLFWGLVVALTAVSVAAPALGENSNN
ncbi:uncharacterized protein LOC113215805 [Frankliniella occidentalis]|uniref:Uncharacterized protein LOC113215805 n=1 Tax=Frankliniella occidentalis TaxID=133901 RepID=A0A9C6XTX1_FRAOC|nr:uncharacterized protein LOC113215805 [Frankliniella occidentalis]XP_052130361.1 uncharacterized protein LOC113215805 [Frankliniella occidentalis]